MERITLEKLKSAKEKTEKALEIARENIFEGREEDAEEIIKMVEAYLSDSEFFEDKGDLVNAFGSIYYAHGWLDCGARLGIFDVSDDSLFTIK